MSTRILPESCGDNWQERLAIVIQAIRAMYVQRDPDSVLRAAEVVLRFAAVDRLLELTRRELPGRQYRIIRASSTKDKSEVGDPSGVLEGGLLADLVYSDEPRIIEDLLLSPEDPAADYLAGQRSLMAIPTQYDEEGASRMLIFLHREPGAFSHNELPEAIWIVNLMGMALRALALSQEVDRSYKVIDDELRTVADIQRSLLPAELPQISTMTLAAQYRTACRSGGDFYDFFPLPNGRWGILIADVSGQSRCARANSTQHLLRSTWRRS